MSAPRLLETRLLETMRAERGRIALLDRHLDRLAASARALGYPLDLTVVAEAVAEAVGGAPAEVGAGTAVRLTLGPAGDVAAEVGPLPAEPLRTAWVDPEPLAEAGTPRCAFKTTDRDHYRARLDRARARGADEAVLLNARGEVTEGTRTNAWAEVGGRLLTPPLAAGGLGGVMRAHVLTTRPRAAEATLTPADLRAADAVFLSNALRGWMPVRLLDEPGRPASEADGPCRPSTP